jgi:glycogen operon protein
MFYAEADGREDCVYLAANAHWEGHSLELPELPDHLAWHVFADTYAEPASEAVEPGREPVLADQSRVHIGPRSVLVLVANQPTGK